MYEGSFREGWVQSVVFIKKNVHGWIVAGMPLSNHERLTTYVFYKNTIYKFLQLLKRQDLLNAACIGNMQEVKTPAQCRYVQRNVIIALLNGSGIKQLHPPGSIRDTNGQMRIGRYCTCE